MTELHSNPKTKPAGFIPRRFRIRADIAVLSAQGTWWRGKDGRYIKVRDMTPEHRRNAARLMERSAGVLATSYAWALLRLAAGAPDDVANTILREGEVAGADPLAWIRSTAICKALTADQPRFDGATPDELMAREGVR